MHKFRPNSNKLVATKVEEEGKNNMSSTPRITPTFQMVLNKQIGKIMDAIDEGNVELAYVCTKTLIDSLKPEDRDSLLKNDVKLIDDQLQKVGGGESIDYYMGLLRASKEQENILYKNIRPLYRKVMTKLHNGKYLEKSSRYLYAKDFGEFEDKNK